ncbi:MAG: xanthine dehydrogenase family protein molybdopterin-binding subunit [Dehalococcoidia bacterium]
MAYAGQSLRRYEDHRLLTGQTSYVDDIKLPGLLHAIIVRSQYSHARIRSIDTAAAQNLPGVVAVVTAEDLKGAFPGLPTRSDPDIQEVTAPIHPVLAQDKVCYVGQPVAVVLAQDLYAAQDAAELVQVDYEPLPPVIDSLAALEPESPVVHENMDSNVALRTVNAGGDLETAFGQAEHVVRQRYHVQRLAPAPMEPRGLVAEYRSQGDLLTIWDSTQHPHEIRHHLAQLLNREVSSIRLVAPDVGGGFGEKGPLYSEEVIVSHLAISLGRPIKWMENRQENMLAFHGRGHVVDLEAAAKRDGTLLGIRVNIVADLGAYFLLSTPTVPNLTSHRLTGPYRTPNMSVAVQGVVTNKPPTGAYRGAGGPEAAFCMERSMDLLAQDLGMDPAEIRRKNLIAPDSFPYETPTGITYDSGNYAPALDRVLEVSDYAGWRAKAQETNQGGGRLLGVGLATVVKGSGGRTPTLGDHGRVIVEPSGQITIHTGISPHGQGSETTFAQVVADELGVTPAEVQVLHSDTDIVAAGGGTSGSRGLVAGTNALHPALQESREKLARIASHLLECAAEEVEFRDGQAFNRQAPDQAMPFSQVASAAYDEERLPPGVEPGVDFTSNTTLSKSPYGFGAHVAVVEVDPDNGSVTLLHYTAVNDSGKIINPLLADGQVHGALAQGIGQALVEGMIYSPDGQPLTGSLMDYAVPRATTLPDFTLESLETPSPLNPLGVKGIGELPTLAAPVAVANAVMDALSHAGVRHIDTPLTPEKIWQALHQPNQQ